MDHAPRAGGQVGCRATERPVVTCHHCRVLTCFAVTCQPLLWIPHPALGSPKATSASFGGREHSPCSLQRRGPCLSPTSLTPTPTGGRWTQKAVILRGLPTLPAQPRSWTLPVPAWQEGICGPRVSIPAASPPPVPLGAGGLAPLSLLPRPLRLHSVSQDFPAPPSSAWPRRDHTQHVASQTWLFRKPWHGVLC